ncbi:MAG TPA: ATP-binding protein [Gemmatimonadaceae bacterium]
MAIATDDDVVIARQRAREIAAAVGLDVHQQTRLSTAVSELVRNVQQYAREGRVTFLIDDGDEGRYVIVRVSDDGPGIPHIEKVLDGAYISPTGMGIGLAGARRLSDRFDIETETGKGTTVTIGKCIPGNVPVKQIVQAATSAVGSRVVGGPSVELRFQNRELMAALSEVEQHRDELARVNAELEETNRGVVALYAELDERAEDLRRASESKSRFLSTISHELRTPLTSVLNLSRLLLDRLDGELTFEQERQITLIRNSVSSLTEMVNDLLDLAKIEAGKTTLHLTRFAVSDLLGGLRGTFRPVMSNAAVALVFDDVDPELWMCSDEGKLTQVVRNFVSNAVKFTEKGEIQISVTPRDELIRFSVRDTGIGIAPENRRRVFEEFAQVDSARQRFVKGTGLGLSLAVKIAQLLYGDVGLDSELGVGSTFWIEVPRVDARSRPDCSDVSIDVSENIPNMGNA